MVSVLNRAFSVVSLHSLHLRFIASHNCVVRIVITCQKWVRQVKNEASCKKSGFFLKIFEKFKLNLKKFDLYKIACHSTKNIHFFAQFFVNILIFIVYKDFKVKSGGHRKSWGDILRGLKGGSPQNFQICFTKTC